GPIPFGRIRLAALLAPAALLAVLSAAGCKEAPPPARVVLVTIDTLRADRLGAYGYGRDISPTIDALAAEGTLFENASSTTPLTGPAHAGILTGRYPLVTGFRNNGSALLAPEERTLPEVLKERGFRTAAVVSCLVLSSHFGFDQGFDLYYDEDIHSELGRGLWFEERKADKTVDRTLRWIEAEKERPFFVWMHLFDPHHPYDPPGADLKSPPEQRYDDEIAFADRELGRFFDRLRQMDLWDDTLVIVAGDHGEALGEHHERFHGVFIYQSTMHVPLIVRLPGAPKGRRVSDLTSIIDIAPTVLAALGMPPLEQVQGVSLLDAVKGSGRVPARSPYLESIYGSSSYGWAPIFALRTSRWKYIDLPTPELYDLEADPGETRNLALAEPARAQEARGEFQRVKTGLESIQRDDAETAPMDDEMRERLLSLGYISGTESKLRKGEPRDPKEVAEVAEGISLVSKLRGTEYEKGIEAVLQEVLRVDPENKMGLVQYARFLAKEKRLEEAIAMMRRAIEIYPDTEELYRSLGWMLIRNERHNEAIALFSDGLQAMPSSASVLYLYGYANFRAGNWERALEALGESLKLNPTESKAYYLSGLCQEKLGRRDAAYATFDRYLKREPRVQDLFVDPYLAEFRKDPRFSSLVKPYL
ncbi:MAG TPA: sulfatase-like hydrolase/transferase, partial [Candidatus Polarisedimenticolia bacterium]|nr:sulfatase-like hydrolase/transferase [Candidatus Polarisedimenticolia bacterium]